MFPTQGFSNQDLTISYKRLLVPQQWAQTQIIHTMIPNKWTMKTNILENGCYFHVWVAKINKKWATKSISKCKRNFNLKQWHWLKNIKWTQLWKRFFLRTDVNFTHVDFIEEEGASSSLLKLSVLPYILCRWFSFSSVVPYHLHCSNLQ